MKIPQDLVAAGGLALGGIFGLIGTVVTDQSVRAASWAIDSVGLVVATVLLTLMYFRKTRLASGHFGGTVERLGADTPVTRGGSASQSRIASYCGSHPAAAPTEVQT